MAAATMAAATMAAAMGEGRPGGKEQCGNTQQNWGNAGSRVMIHVTAPFRMLPMP
jgi:hypothetical protein